MGNSSFVFGSLDVATQSELDAGLALKVDKDSVVAAGTRIFESKLLAGDTQPAVQLLGDGTLKIGAGGSTAPDVELKRDSANVLELPDQLFIHRASAANLALQIKLDADAQARLTIGADGIFNFGDGTSAPDTNFYRHTVSRLRTDDNLWTRAITVHSGTHAIEEYNNADTDANPRMRLDSGSLEFGTGGASALDVKFYRSAANVWKMDDALHVDNSSGIVILNESAGAIRAFTGTDANPKMRLDSNTLEWGAGGASALDTVIARLDANRIGVGTGDTFELGTATSTGQYFQLWEQSADPSAPAANAVRLYAKDTGAGKTALYAIFATGGARLIADEL